ncbi:hypothetical protein C8J56DRAFT_1163348 [Mycena floridula]|nr:hypothetical protein C8J56DRAFT_1163348 [Mycena floridula]
MIAHHIPRAESISSFAAPSASLSSTASASGITVPAAPFDPTGLPPDSSNVADSNNNNKGDFGKAMVEYIFLALAFLLLVMISWRRILRIRRIRQGLEQPSTVHYTYPRTRPVFSPYSQPPFGMTPLAAAYSTDRRPTRGAGIGPGGQRDAPEVGDKDVLPAYDKFGSPPQYAERAAVTPAPPLDPSATTSAAASH